MYGTCHSSTFKHQPVGHVVTGDLNIIDNEALKTLISKGPKYREPRPYSWKKNFKLIMDAVETHARKWVKREHAESSSLSEWIKSIRSLVKRRIHILSKSCNTKHRSLFTDPKVANCLSDLHRKFVVVPADKAANNVVFICKKFYVECLLDELNIKSPDAINNSTYQLTGLSAHEILANHQSVLTTYNIRHAAENRELPTLYWIPKLHKYPYKQRFIAGSSKCSTRELSKLLTIILSKVKEGLIKYCDTIYSRSGINQMWILKNSKELLERLKSHSLSRISSLKTYDFSTLYTTIPHDKLKTTLEAIIHNTFIHRNGQHRYKYIVIKNTMAYFVKEHSDAPQKYTEVEVINMLNFLLDNIYVSFGGCVFQQTTGIPMGTNCAPLLADLFLYYYEADFIQNIMRRVNGKNKTLFNFTFRYIDDVLSINNSKIGNYLDAIYPSELDIKDTSDTPTSVNYLDIKLEIGENQHLSTKIYDKRDDFTFSIVNFPFVDGNIPTSPAYGVFVSQLLRYARGSSAYDDFVCRGAHLTSKLIRQGYSTTKLRASFKKFYGRHYEFVSKYGKCMSHILKDLFGTPSLSVVN